MSNTKQACLFVSFKNFDEVDKQEVLELALDFMAVPFSCPEDKNTLVFEVPSVDVLNRFKESLLRLNLELDLKEYYR